MAADNKCREDMKRQIIFRGKRLDNGEWVEGYFVRLGEGAIIITASTLGPDLLDDCDHALEYRVDEFAPVNPETVGQWTGLTDSKGKRIFEGDIIECISSDGTPIRHCIQFNAECGHLSQYIIDRGGTDEMYEAGAISQRYIDRFDKYVISNIYDIMRIDTSEAVQATKSLWQSCEMASSMIREFGKEVEEIKESRHE